MNNEGIELSVMDDEQKKQQPGTKPRSCVRCGSCKALCPVYAEIASEGMSPRGRITLLKKLSEGEISPSVSVDEKLFTCILCGACNKSCPVGINITDEVYSGRKELRHFNNKRRVLNFAVRLGLKKAVRGYRALKFAENISSILPVHKIELFKAFFDAGVKLPASHLRQEKCIFKAPKPKGRIALFAGCTANFMYPHIGMSLINILNAINYDVVMLKGEVCCGAPFAGLGLEEDASELAEKNIRLFKDLSVDALIGLCPTCVNFIKNDYKRLIGEGINNAMEASQFLSGELSSSGIESENLSRIIYHDPCHSIHSLNVKLEPRHVLKNLGLTLTEPKNRGCCGFGGAFKLLYLGLSEDILEKRTVEYADADMIVTSCPNCILQFKTKIKDKPVVHLVELVEKSISGAKNERKKQIHN